MLLQKKRADPKYFRGTNPKNAVHFAAWDRIYKEHPELPQEHDARIRFIGDTVAKHQVYQHVKPEKAATD
eukprot:1874135-Amphidinium_carterae.1